MQFFAFQTFDAAKFCLRSRLSWAVSSFATTRPGCPLGGPEPKYPEHVGFSNRPFEVKHFQTIRHCNFDVAHGLALLFGVGTRALFMGFEDEVEQSFGRPCRLADSRS